MEQLIIQFIEFLKQFSYFGIILALSIETIPAEIVLPMAGYWVFQGDMNFLLAVLAGTFGGTLGPLTLYVLGRYGGRPMLLKYGKYFFIKEKHIDLSDQFFSRYGASVAFLGRFMPGLRTAISIPCGISKMNIWVFSLYTFMAMLPITTLYIYLGTKLGANWHNVGPLASQYMLPVSGIIVLSIIAFTVYKFKFKRTLNS